MGKRGYTGDYGALGIFQNIDKFVGKTKQSIADASSQVAKELEDYARQNHPWQNRTGFLESSIHAEVVQQGQQVGVVLYAGLDEARKNYAIFLELFMDGKWTWMLPALLAMQGRIIEIYVEYLNRTVTL